jgi:hypothetical protein
MTFSFFGIFADPAAGLREQFSQQWSDADVVEIGSPIKAVGLRFSERHYEPDDEDVPESINREIERLSTSYPGIRLHIPVFDFLCSERSVGAACVATGGT